MPRSKQCPFNCGLASVGLYAIQIAVHYGLEVITTSSPKHFDTVKALGAKHAFDYNDENVADEMKRVAPDLKYVFDTIGKETTSQVASQAIHPTGGTLCTVRPGKAFTENVTKQTKVTDVLVWTAFLKEHRYKEFSWPVNIGDIQTWKIRLTFIRLMSLIITFRLHSLPSCLICWLLAGLRRTRPKCSRGWIRFQRDSKNTATERSLATKSCTSFKSQRTRSVSEVIFSIFPIN